MLFLESQRGIRGCQSAIHFNYAFYMLLLFMFSVFRLRTDPVNVRSSGWVNFKIAHVGGSRDECVVFSARRCAERPSQEMDLFSNVDFPRVYHFLPEGQVPYPPMRSSSRRRFLATASSEVAVSRSILRFALVESSRALGISLTPSDAPSKYRQNRTYAAGSCSDGLRFGCF